MWWKRVLTYERAPPSSRGSQKGGRRLRNCVKERGGVDGVRVGVRGRLAWAEWGGCGGVSERVA